MKKQFYEVVKVFPDGETEVKFQYMSEVEADKLKDTFNKLYADQNYTFESRPQNRKIPVTVW